MGYQLDMEDFHKEKKGMPQDSYGIKQAMETAQDELRAAIMNGQSELMLELDARLRILSARLFGTEVAETKKAIDSAEESKIKIAKEIEILREIKKQKNLAAGRAEQLFFKRMERVADAQLQIEFAESRLVSARTLARESKARLQKLLDAKQEEVTNQRERYELSRY